MCSTVPLPENLRQQIMPQRLPISDARRLLAYMRYDSEGRFMIGARGSFGLHEPQSYFDRLRAVAITIFPQLSTVQWDDAWGGRFALTANHLPHIHQPEEGLFTTIGCNGRGVAMMSQIGTVIGELACGRLTHEECPVPLTPLRTIPLHAFRRPGLEAVTLWYRLRDRLSFPRRRSKGQQ
jgi:glycine/D-amino acid oxidase-like deaminating enzyme